MVGGRIASGEPLIIRAKYLESFVTKKRDKSAALKFLRKSMKRYGNSEVVETDMCPSYRNAMKVIGNEKRQEADRDLNNCAENSHLPLRRRERVMSRFQPTRRLRNIA